MGEEYANGQVKSGQGAPKEIIDLTTEDHELPRANDSASHFIWEET